MGYRIRDMGTRGEVVCMKAFTRTEWEERMAHENEMGVPQKKWTVAKSGKRYQQIPSEHTLRQRITYHEAQIEKYQALIALRRSNKLHRETKKADAATEFIKRAREQYEKIGSSALKAVLQANGLAIAEFETLDAAVDALMMISLGRMTRSLGATVMPIELEE